MGGWYYKLLIVAHSKPVVFFSQETELKNGNLKEETTSRGECETVDKWNGQWSVVMEEER